MDSITSVTPGETAPVSVFIGACLNDAASPPCTERFRFGDTPGLTAALRAGDEAAFRWLHGQWNARIYRYCFALAAGDDALAGEIAQNTYLRTARHVRVLPDETALWAWVAKAARSAAADLRRVGGRYAGALARFAAWFQAEPPAGDDGLLAALDGALAKLEEAERALVEARYFRREPLEDTGARLGCSARAIEGRLARVREKLRQLLAEQLQTL